MSRKLAKTRIQSGFTIIEVMIVLAIAGLILSVVLIAVPQLQKSQRNEARRSILNRISTEIGNYSGNNGGRIPESTAAGGAVTGKGLPGFTSRYLDGVNIEDPSSGAAFTVEVGIGTAGQLPTLPDIGKASYLVGFSCDGEFLDAGNPRSYALWTQLEGGAVYCLDNL